MTTQPDDRAATQVVWLFGHPVGHSLSPTIQNAAFKHDGIDLRYVARDVTVDALEDAVAALRAPNTRGANVTLPHKETVIPLLDQVEAEAARVGAVNTVVNNDGCLNGHNTDLGGFLGALHTLLPGGATDLACLVLGAGGAARAVLAALGAERAATVWVANRTAHKAQALCEEADDWSETDFMPVALEEMASVAPNAQIIVNATSLGLPGSVKELPLDVDILQEDQVVVDLAYDKCLTALVQAARARGLRAIDGKEMLVQQASLSFELWTGQEASISVMRGSIGDCQR